MTEDANIPDGLGDSDAKRFINEADDRIFKRVDKSGRRSRPKGGHPIYWECPKCHTCTNDKSCPICKLTKEQPTSSFDWEHFKSDIFEALGGLLVLVGVVWLALLLYISFLFVLNGFHF